MPYNTTVYRPGNNLRLATFWMWPNRHYRIADSIEFSMDVEIAWCHRCEEFVECERLYTEQEIQDSIDKIAAWDWEDEDSHRIASWVERARNYPDSSDGIPMDLTCQALYDAWVAALAWRKARKTPPRCLECGSFFAIVVIPHGKDVPHPGGDGLVRIGGGEHGSFSSWPTQLFYNAEGLLIDQLEYQEWRRLRSRPLTESEREAAP